MAASSAARWAASKPGIHATQSSGTQGKWWGSPEPLGHALTFLQLHTLEVEGVPQDIAAAWLILLGEEQQIRIRK